MALTRALRWFQNVTETHTEAWKGDSIIEEEKSAPFQYKTIDSKDTINL